MTRPLFKREDVVIACVDHTLGQKKRIGLKDVIAFPLLMLEQGSTSRALLDRVFLEAGLQAQIAMELGSIEVIKRFVEIGQGIAIVPEVAVREEVVSGRLRAVQVAGLPVREVGVVQRSGGHLSRAAEVFLAFLEDYVEEKDAL